MKYEMLGACLDYLRPLHLTRHNTQFTAGTKGVHHTDLTRNMEIGWSLCKQVTCQEQLEAEHPDI